MLQKATVSDNKLTRRQLAALPHVALSGSISEGARRAGVSRAAVHRWLNNPHFRREIDNLRNEVAELARTRIQDMTAAALQVIEDSLHDERQSARFRAAVTVLDLARRGLHDKDVDRRLDWLEDSLFLKEEPR